MNRDMKKFLDAVATKHGVPLTEIILRAVYTFRFLSKVLELDGVVILKYANGDEEMITSLYEAGPLSRTM
jgi:hypothetical protein